MNNKICSHNADHKALACAERTTQQAFSGVPIREREVSTLIV